MGLVSSSFPWWFEKLYPHILTFIALAMLFFTFAMRKWRSTPGESWRVVEGRVQQAKMIRAGGRDPGKYAVISYSYFVDEYRSGEYTRTFLREDPAQKFVEAMKDKKVEVHYNPRNPAVSNLKDAEVDHLLLRMVSSTTT